jgi:hypothetical protein
MMTFEKETAAALLLAATLTLSLLSFGAPSAAAGLSSPCAGMVATESGGLNVARRGLILVKSSRPAAPRLIRYAARQKRELAPC